MSSGGVNTHKVDLQGVLAGPHLDGERLGLEVALSLVEPLVCVEDGNTPGSKTTEALYISLDSHAKHNTVESED